MSITAIRRTARGALHSFMGRPAHYFPVVTNPLVFVTTKARAHSKRAMVGDLPGTNLNYAEMIDRKERVVLWREDVPNPARLALIVFSADEAYWVDSIDPPDGQTITVNVTMADASEIVGLTLPGV